MRRQVFYLDAPGGGRFCLVAWPDSTPIGGVLYIHPFAEELNKSRRMAALGTQAFVDQGWAVLQMDLFGCGDSAGDFGQATWASWLDDISRAWALLVAMGAAPSVLWTVRAGSLLAADWLACHDGPYPALLMWQPVTNGRQHLTQFLRLKAASEMLLEGDAGVAMTEMRADLDSGRAVEIAGYELSAPLAKDMDASKLRLPEAYRGMVGVFEICGGDRVEPSPVLRVLQQKWSGPGIDVELDVLSGVAFWQTQEIETVPALIDKSVAWLDLLSP